MTYFIDQSGKIEDTAHHTVIALTNGYKHSVLLGASDKRLLQNFFRQKSHPRTFIYKTFSALLVILLEKVLPSIQPHTKIIIDREYPGHEPEIKAYVLNAMDIGMMQNLHLDFAEIGKSSDAHLLAYDVYKGRKRPHDRVVLKKILELL